MAEITEARFRMADGTGALFVGEAAEMPDLPEWPFLAIHVDNLDAARDLLDVLERSRARKRTGEKEAEKPGPGPLPPKCIAPNCDVEAVPGKDACAMRENVGESVLAEWRRAKEKEQGRRRARGLREGVEGEPGTAA